jgi:glycine/D-amino acid oxidase-like deaminating enzyme
VVGAGIAGVSTAFFAARAGLRVALVERGLPAGGASGRAAGYIRCHYANEPETHFAVASWRMHREWADVVGGDNGFRPVGFLFVVPPPLVPPLEKNVDALRRRGIATEVVDPAGLRELQPFMDVEGVGAAAYEPDSGYADPADTVASLLAGLRARGGRVLVETAPVELRVAGGRVAGVRAGTEEIAASRVVLAAGAGSRELAAQVGVDLPVFPMPIGAGLVHRPGAPAPMCVIDHAAEQWYRGEIGEAMVVGAGYEDSIGFRGEPFHGKTTFAPPTRDELVRAAAGLLRRIPDLERARLGPTWVGLDSRTPDGHAVVGPLGGIDGLWVLTGGNGKGFKFGPPMGQALVEVLLGGDFARSPLAPFALERYAEGRVIRGEHEYAWGSFA